MTFVISLTTGLSVFALNSGDTISYSSEKNGGNGDSNPLSGGAVKFESGEYIGTCIQAGPPPGGSGSAKIKKPSDELKRAAYYFGIEKNWQNGLGDADENARRLELILQYLNGTMDSWASGRNVVESILANNPEWETVDIPSTFECWYCTPNDSGVQDFLLWKYIPTGKLSLRKVSANMDITG